MDLRHLAVATVGGVDALFRGILGTIVNIRTRRAVDGKSIFDWDIL